MVFMVIRVIKVIRVIGIIRVGRGRILKGLGKPFRL